MCSSKLAKRAQAAVQGSCRMSACHAGACEQRLVLQGDARTSSCACLDRRRRHGTKVQATGVCGSLRMTCTVKEQQTRLVLRADARHVQQLCQLVQTAMQAGVAELHEVLDVEDDGEEQRQLLKEVGLGRRQRLVRQDLEQVPKVIARVERDPSARAQVGG